MITLIKNNVARDLESVSLPNGLVYRPQNYLYGRASEKLLTDGTNNRFGEYVYYRKVGNRATGLVSSVRYGNIKNGQYVIGEGLKYTYDANGNIIEVYENGMLCVKYAYDAIRGLCFCQW